MHTSRDNSEQDVLNSVYDEDYGVLKTSYYGSNGQTLQRGESDDLQIKAVVSGSYTYFCFSAPGTPEATPLWKIFRLDNNGSLVYADGDAKFDNAATDPASLTYTYG